MKLKWIYQIQWALDSVDQMYYFRDIIPVLHFSNDGKTWEPVPYGEFPTIKQQEEMFKDRPLTKAEKEYRELNKS